MKPFEYLLCQMELEGIRRVSGDLITPSSPKVDDLPFVLIARTSDGQNLICLDATLPNKIRSQLPKDDLQACKTGKAIKVFEGLGMHVKASHFITYIFPEGMSADPELVNCYSKDDPKIVDFGFHGLADQVYAIEKERTILSACVSSRQNSSCAEAWVFTHPDHRLKGLAQKVVTAWANNTKAEGLIPFYSHNIENINSALLASRLNLIWVFEEIVIEKAS